jgi:hypothetical protein
VIVSAFSLSRTFIVAALVLAFVPRSTLAAELEWSAPPPCPDQREAVRAVERVLGSSLEQAIALRVTVHVQQAPRGFSAELTTASASAGDPRQKRELSSASCDELLEAVALSAAVAIGDATQALPTEPAATAPVAAGDVAPKSDTPADPRTPVPWGVRAAIVGDSGSLPEPSPGIAVALESVWGGVEVHAGGTLFASRRVAVDRGEGLVPSSIAEGSEPGAVLGLLLGSLGACVPISGPTGVLPLGACAGLEAGVMSGEGRGVSNPRRGDAFWLAATLGLEGRWPQVETGFMGFLGLGVVAPFLRDDFELRDLGSVHQAANVSARLNLGARYRFMP